MNVRTTRAPRFTSTAANGRGSISIRSGIYEPLLGLMKEHEVVMNETCLLLTIVKKITQRQKGPEALAGKAKLNMDRLKKLLSTHQTREEETLLPMIKKCLDSEASQSIRREHQQISSALQKADVAIATLEANSPQEPLAAATKSLAEFDALMRAHFSREENVLFWFASLCLSKSYSPHLTGHTHKNG